MLVLGLILVVSPLRQWDSCRDLSGAALRQCLDDRRCAVRPVVDRWEEATAALARRAHEILGMERVGTTLVFGTERRAGMLVVRIDIGHTGGQLEVWSPAGHQLYDVAIAQRGDTVVIEAHLVYRSDY